MKDTSKSVHYFFTDEFINKYKNDYKQMRQEIVEFNSPFGYKTSVFLLP